MASEEQKRNDFYAVLGLKKECTASELRNAYKKLAMRWHPDRCSASGNSKFVEEAKKKFQAIQEAYSVLSDPNKRFLYDVGVYDSDDDENGMGDFLNEMASMMSQTKPNENDNNESFEQLQELFEEMFQMDAESFSSTSQAVNSTTCSTSAASSSYAYCESSSNNKRNSSDMNSGKANSSESSAFDACFQSFCVGAEHQQNIGTRNGSNGRVHGRADGRVHGRAGDRRRHRKQKVSSGQDVSASEYSGIFTQ